MTKNIARKEFNDLCTSPSGILLENSSVIIGVRQEYEGAEGRVTVYIGNVSQAPLHNIRVSLDSVDHLRIQTEATEGLLEKQGCTIAVGTQAKLLLLVEVLAPFDDAPAIRVMYRTENGMNQEHHLKLPIVTSCFMTPLMLELQVFKNQWHAFENQECRTILKSVQANQECMKHIAELIHKLNLERCYACDDTPWSVSGASVFHTSAKDVNGHAVNVECLVRIEADHHHHRAVR